MKKLTFVIACLSTLGVSYAGTIGPASQSALTNNWTGLYMGANAGGWWSQNNSVDTDGTPLFVHTPFPPEFPNALANALADIGTNDLSVDSHGFIGGGQVGANYQMGNRLVVGLEADFDGLQHGDDTDTRDVDVFVPAPQWGMDTNYRGTISTTKNINYLGTVRGRLGWLFTPAFLIYGTGGFAYGGVSLNTVIEAENSFGAPFLEPLIGQNKVNQTQTGWTIGAGSEWMFRPNWSARIEYLYYDLGTIKNKSTLEQEVFIPDPYTGVIAAANVRTSAPISVGTVRFGVNYHFS